MLDTTEKDKYFDLIEALLNEVFVKAFIKEYNKIIPHQQFRNFVIHDFKFSQDHVKDILSILIQTGKAKTKDDKIELLEAS